MRGDKELEGTLRGFDVFVNMVLEDVTEVEKTPDGDKVGKAGAPGGTGAGCLTLHHKLFIPPTVVCPSSHMVSMSWHTVVRWRAAGDALGPNTTERQQYSRTYTWR